MADPLMSDLAARRTALGLSQKALARRVGVQQATISRWEKGQRSPHLSQLRRLALALGCEVDYTVKETPDGR